MNRRGKFSPVPMLFILSLIALGALIAILALDRRKPLASKKPLLVYCAAGIKAPIEKIARNYENEFGIPIELQFGGSNTQLASARASGKGDLFLAADESYVKSGRQQGLIHESFPIASMHPIIAVRKGNPKNIQTLDDLLKEDIQIAQANPDAAAIGKLTKPALEKAGYWDKLKPRTRTFEMTVNDVGNAIKLGTVDAGIVWDITVRQFEGLEAVQSPVFDSVNSSITLGVLSSSTDPAAAIKFARYVTAADKGLVVFKKNGYTVVAGDRWTEFPEVRVLAGAMLRPAIDETLTAFEQREGCRITRVYNGCGILVAQMKAGERPDAYFACDTSFMREVTDLFIDPAEVSINHLVIVVPRGNPHHVASLKDLGQPGLRVGVGREKQCALGALTRKTLEQVGLHDSIMENVKVQSPTGDFLVNQLRTGSLDAVVAYVSNTTSAKGEVQTIPVDVPCATAIQPVAIGRESQHKFLMGRLLDALESRQSRERFVAQGFDWMLGAPPQSSANAR